MSPKNVPDTAPAEQQQQRRQRTEPSSAFTALQVSHLPLWRDLLVASSEGGRDRRHAVSRRDRSAPSSAFSQKQGAREPDCAERTWCPAKFESRSARVARPGPPMRGRQGRPDDGAGASPAERGSRPAGRAEEVCRRETPRCPSRHERRARWRLAPHGTNQLRRPRRLVRRNLVGGPGCVCTAPRAAYCYQLVLVVRSDTLGRSDRALSGCRIRVERHCDDLLCYVWSRRPQTCCPRAKRGTRADLSEPVPRSEQDHVLLRADRRDYTGSSGQLPKRCHRSPPLVVW